MTKIGESVEGIRVFDDRKKLCSLHVRGGHVIKADTLYDISLPLTVLAEVERFRKERPVRVMLMARNRVFCVVYG